MGKPKIYEGSAIPTDLTFDNIVISYSTSDFTAKGATKVINYTILVIDIRGRTFQQTGSVTIIGR